MTTDYTDQVYQEVKLFIEGIQVPYLNISIRQTYQSLPSASLEIPALVGLETIDKFYNPKVHIFTVDPVMGEDILLFHGLIMGHEYSKQTTGHGQKSISYHCKHPYSLLEQITLFYSPVTKPGQAIQTQKDAVDRQYVGSLTLLMIEALTGITKAGPTQGGSSLNVGGTRLSGTKEAFKPTAANWDELPGSLHDPVYRQRLVGMPGVLIKMWNILKTDPNNHLKNPMLDDMYIPLMEGGVSGSANNSYTMPGTGLNFFKRLSGISFLENTIDEERVEVSYSDNSKKSKGHEPKYNVLVPPMFNVFDENIMKYLIPRAMRNLAESGDEYTNFLEIIQRFTHFIDYDITCLSSPAQVQLHHQPIDFIIKPQTPFYYSPICNVIFPNMYDDLRIQDETGTTPTRLLGDLNLNFISQKESFVEVFRSPPSVLKAAIQQQKQINKKNDKTTTLAEPATSIGRFEYGRGVKSKSIILPDWVYLIESSILSEHKQDSSSQNTTYNSQYDDLIFSTIDVEYTKQLAGSRTGEVSGAFNPYVVPGFPLDVLDEDYLAPSYHGLCTSVTHSITSDSIRTQIGFTSVLSYNELGSYSLPPNYPWLDQELGTQTGEWVNVPYNSKVRQKADQLYTELLGLPAVDPGDLYDFKQHQVLPITRDHTHSAHEYQQGTKESQKDENGLETNPWLSYRGNLYTAYRPIETLKSIEKLNTLKFVHFNDQVNMPHQSVPFIDTTSYKNQKEFGQNLFLDYDYPK